MGKRGSNRKSGSGNPKKIKPNENVPSEDMYDEVDIFHKQRDKIPLDINGDSAESDEDDEQPVFDYKGNDDSEDDDDEEDEEDDDDEDDDDDEYDKSFSKIERTQKYLKAKHGNLEDEFIDDAEEPEDKKTVWGRRKSIYHDADNIDYELQSSDEGSAEEEEAEAIRLRKETAKSMTMEDFGIEDDEKDEADAEPTFEEILVKQKDASVTSKSKDAEDNLGITYEQVEKDLSSLSKDEQMDVVSSSAPELVGLLSELDDALKQLDEVNPLISKVKLQKDIKKVGDLHYLEVKKLLLLAYCQAITFYLLLKSEGQPVRDHPVIARLVEIKSLLDKTKELDTNLPPQLEVLLDENVANAAQEYVEKRAAISTEHPCEPIVHKEPLAVKQKVEKPKTVEVLELEVPNGNGLENKAKLHDKPISSQSVKMLSARAALEEKLKQKGVFTTLEPSQKTKKHKLRPHNSQLETFDDFGDDAVDGKGLSNGNTTLSNKVSQLISAKGKKNKVSGDEDLPQRDDLGERRRKHELRVLAGAGVTSTDDGVEDDEPDSVDGEDADESEDELTELQSAIASKNPNPAEPETTLDGKRLITQQMEKNRGLTPRRKKLTKNPRKKYKLKHEKAKKRHTGQVRQVRRPEGPYGGEATGINAGVSRSVRFKG